MIIYGNFRIFVYTKRSNVEQVHSANAMMSWTPRTTLKAACMICAAPYQTEERCVMTSPSMLTTAEGRECLSEFGEWRISAVSFCPNFQAVVAFWKRISSNLKGSIKCWVLFVWCFT